MIRTDDTHRDGATLIQWAGGKLLAWDVSIVENYAESHIHYKIAIAIAIAKLINIAALTLTTIVQQRFTKTKKIQKYNIKQQQC